MIGVLMAYNRPKKYSATAVDSVNLYNLHKHCDFVQILSAETGREEREKKEESHLPTKSNLLVKENVKPLNKKDNQQSKLDPEDFEIVSSSPSPASSNANYLDTLKEKAYAYQFKKGRKKITYFPVVIDSKSRLSDSGYNDCHYLNDLLNVYVQLRNENKIGENELTIIPLGQQRKGREHYNTLIIQGENAYLIEPRSSNRMIVRDYPVSDIIVPVKNALQDIYKRVIPITNIKNIFIKQQDYINDTDCGAFQTNYTEQLMTLQSPELPNKKQLKGILRTTRLARRNDDTSLINYITQFFTVKKNDPLFNISNNAKVGPHSFGLPRDINDNTLNALHKSLEKNVKEKDLSDVQKNTLNIAKEPVEQEIQSSSAKKSSEQEISENSTMESIESSNEILPIENSDRASKLDQSNNFNQFDKAIAAINEIYISAVNHSFFKCSHTREQTAKTLIQFLNTCKDNPTNANHDRAINLLFNYYAVLEDKRGSMGKTLGKALAELMDIKLEYSEAWDCKTSYYLTYDDHVENLMADTINNNFKDARQLVNNNQSYLIRKLFKYINDRETSFLYKIASSERKYEMDLKLQFAREQILKLNKGEQPETINMIDDERKKNLLLSSELNQILNAPPPMRTRRITN